MMKNSQNSRQKINSQALYDFLPSFFESLTPQALKKLFPKSHLSYANIPAIDKEFFLSLNFADSLIFAPRNEVIHTFTALEETTYLDCYEKDFESKEQLINLFSSPPKQWLSLCQAGRFKKLSPILLQTWIHLIQGKSFSKKDFEILLSPLESNEQKNLVELYNYSCCVKKLRSELPHLPYTSSLYPISYSDYLGASNYIEKELKKNKKGSICLWVAPYQIDWERLLLPHQKRNFIFLFTDIFSLDHALHIESFSRVFYQKPSAVLILNEYPNTQLKKQRVFKKNLAPFEFILPPYLNLNHKEDFFFQKSITECLTQDCFNTDSKEGNILYHLGRSYYLRNRYERLGPERYYSLYNAESDYSWLSKHKTLPPKDLCSIIPLPSIKPRSSRLFKHRSTKRRKKEHYHLLHVVPQIVDGNHAPSILLSTMLKHSNTERFKLSVFSTERLCKRTHVYPQSLISSSPSYKRASKTIDNYLGRDINVFMDNYKKHSFEQSATYLTNFISINQVDVVFFHGFDPINTMTSQLCKDAFKVGFSHGDHPMGPGMDLIIGSERGILSKKQLFKSWGSEVVIVPPVVDVRQAWEERPFSKSAFQVPENSFMLTTISNHLESRVSPEMAWAIATIIKSIPNTYYMPIGRIDHHANFLAPFQTLGVDKHIIPLGHRSCPSQLARSMDLYLNEFPFGGGLSILDAMAASCPIISMYNSEGPTQSRNGGAFYGLGHAVHSNRKEDYAALACHLLKHPKLHKKWREKACATYDSRSCQKTYLSDLEDYILSYI